MCAHRPQGDTGARTPTMWRSADMPIAAALPARAASLRAQPERLKRPVQAVAAHLMWVGAGGYSRRASFRQASTKGSSCRLS